MTHKSTPAVTDGRFKVFNELEIGVDNFEATRQILESLGFHPRQVYENWRETMRLDNALVCLDQMPYGNFLEIEGNPDAIRSTADRLGLDWERRVLMNYLEIFSRLKTALALPFSDLTFDNFETHSVDSADLKFQLESILSAASKS